MAIGETTIGKPPSMTERGRSQHSSDTRSERGCPKCTSELKKRHCKLVCPIHGVIFDCSDPFR